MLTERQSLENFRKIDEKLERIFRPRVKIPPSEWAEVHRRHSPESSSKKHGRWYNFPMQREPMDCAVDPTVRSVCMIWASQTAGKTEVINTVIGWLMDQEPCPILMVQPDIDLAKAWSQDRLDPMLRDTPILTELMDLGYNKKGNAVRRKRFPGGQLTAVGANSPSGLGGRPIRATLFDEVDRFPESAGKEGDPVKIAEKRTESFSDAINYKTSTPTIKGHSRIDKEWELSDKRFWFVPCPECKFEQTLKWAQVKWIDILDPWYECENPKCLCKWNDKMRIAAIWKGKWKATAPFKGIRGYHLSGIYNLFAPKKGFQNRLHQMVEEFLEAKRLGKQALKTWINTFLAECWQDEADIKPDWEVLSGHRENYDPKLKIPKDVRCITAGTDFQADRIELEFVGWTTGEESWGLGHHVLWGNPVGTEIYNRLEELLIKQFVREDGAILQLRAAGFDTGFSVCQRQLYTYLRPRLGRRYYAFKGASQKAAQPISHSIHTKVEMVKLILVGTNRIKGFLYNRATISAAGPGYLHFPAEYTDEYFKQFLAEESLTEYINGEEVRVFTMPIVKPEGGTTRNEILDCRVYATAALYACGVPNWDVLEKQNVKTISENIPAMRAQSVSVAQGARQRHGSNPLLNGIHF